MKRIVLSLTLVSITQTQYGMPALYQKQALPAARIACGATRIVLGAATLIHAGYTIKDCYNNTGEGKVLRRHLPNKITNLRSLSKDGSALFEFILLPLIGLKIGVIGGYKQLKKGLSTIVL